MQLLKRLLRYGKSMVFLDRTRQQAHSAFEITRDLFALLIELNADIAQLKQSLEAQGGSLAAQSKTLTVQAEVAVAARRSYEQKLSAVSAAVDLLSRFPALKASPLKEEATSSANPQLSTLLDNFYVELETRFRGATSDISQRQRVYLPDIEQALTNSPSKAVLDLGCGRGEWLALLRGYNIEGVGIDSNEGQLAEARRNGLAVWNRDGLKFLQEQPEGRFAAITAFHIFEHLPFPILAQWIMEIRRVLAPGGILIVETPNPENLIVGAHTFHLDPTHTRPLPSGVLSILVETAGLAVTQLRPLHPHGDLAAALKDLPERTAYLLYGYQDYGLIAQRPVAETL